MLHTKFQFIQGSGFRRENIFRNQPIRNKNDLWWSCQLTDRDEMSDLYREPSIHASYQDLIHLDKQFQRRRFFKNQPIRNKNCLWRPYLLMDRAKNVTTDFYLKVDWPYGDLGNNIWWAAQISNISINNEANMIRVSE